MFEPSSLLLFVAASMWVLLIPGPAVLLVVACSLNQGRKAGMVCVLGLETGTLLQVAAASLGISALVLSSALAFDVIRYLGAAYLVSLGVRKWLERGPAAHGAGYASASLRRLFARGVLLELLNPNTALFLVAFLPQFVDQGRGDVAQQVLALGLIFIALATMVDGGYALLAGSMGRGVRHSERFARAERLLAAILFIGLGLSAALGGTPIG